MSIGPVTPVGAPSTTLRSPLNERGAGQDAEPRRTAPDRVELSATAARLTRAEPELQLSVEALREMISKEPANAPSTNAGAD